MKLEAVNAIAQLIAAIGVIVSLFYLAAQMHLNTPIAASRREI